MSTSDLNLKLPGQSKKLLAKFIGPYTIKRVVNPNAYELDLPESLRQLHPVINITRLRPYKANDASKFPGREVLDRPAPQLEDEDDGYEVEAVVDKMRTRARNGRFTTWYLVKWKGYPDSDNLWRKAVWLRPPHSGSGVWQFVVDYERAHPGPGRIEATEPVV